MTPPSLTTRCRFLSLFGLAVFAMVAFAPAQNRVCSAPDNGTGTIDWPAPCPYGNVLDPVTLVGSDGELVQLTVEIPPMAMTCLPGNPTVYHSGVNATAGPIAIPAFIKYVRQSKAAEARVDLLLSVESTALSPAGADEQVFDTEIVSMSLGLPPTGHPDFDSLILRAQPGGTGKTTLTRLPGGNFNVDSFFDVEYRITFQGAPGGILEGAGVDTVAPMQLRQNLHTVGGVCVRPLGDATVSSLDGELVVSNIGSSGEDGVSLRVGGHGFGNDPDDLCVVVVSRPRLVANGGPGGLIGEGSSVAMFPFPPPPPDFELPPQSIVCTNTGGTVSGVCSSGALQATEWVVELWNGNVLVETAVTPDGSTCFTTPADLFEPSELRVSSRKKGNVPAKYNPGEGRRLSTSMTFPGAIEFNIAGSPTPSLGDRVVLSPRDPRVLPAGFNRLDLKVTSFDPDPDDLCVISAGVGVRGNDHAGLGNAVLSTRGDSLVVSNIGSSGEDGVSIDLGDVGPPYLRLPCELDLRPMDVEGSGGRVIVRAVDDVGGNVATATYVGGGGGGGRIAVEYNTASPVCRVSVLNDGALVGEFDVPLAPSGETEVCRVGTDAAGVAPLLTGCGKLRLGWPWELSCLVEEFDRPVSITPTGGTALVGDEVQLLAPGALPSEVESIRRVQLLAAGGGLQIEVADSSTGADLPPVPTVGETFVLPHVFDTSGRLQGAVESYYTYDPATGQAVCANSTIKDVELQSSAGGIDTYSATLELDVRGVGGSPLAPRTLSLPGSLEIQPGPNNFAGQDVQQQGMMIFSGTFNLPPGDPDFAVVRVSTGSVFGLPSPGQTTLTRLPTGQFHVDSFFDIHTEITIQGTPGGALGGGTVNREQRQVVHGLVKPATTFAGLAHTSVDGAQLGQDAGGRLVVSNIGSSGCDGVSIDLGGAEGFELAFPAVEPLVLAPGGTVHFDEFGDGFEFPVGTLLGTCTVTNLADSFFDVFTDFASVSPSGTRLQVYNRGALVADVPGGATSSSYEFHDASGIGLPPIKGVGKLPGLSATPCKVIRWCDVGAVFIPGQPAPFLGDEVRMLAEGVGFESISRFELRASDVVDNCILIEEELPCYFGRQFAFGGGTRAQGQDYNSSRSNNGSSLTISNIGSSGLDGVSISPPPSTTLSGRRQVWPLTSELGPLGLRFDAPGAHLRVEACGTINGSPGTSYGPLDLIWDGEGVSMRGDWGSRGTTLGDVVVVRELDKSSTKLQEALAVPMGNLGRFHYREEFGPSRGGRLVSVSAVPELYEPPHNEVECSYTLRFSADVEVTLPGQPPVFGNRIDIRLVDPTHVSEDIDCLRLSGADLKPLTLTGVRTGPFGGHGLVHTTLGSAHVDEASPGDDGSLIVSNIGSSGEDGVSIDLDLAEGAWQTLQPVDLISVGGSLEVGIASSNGVDDDCDGAVDDEVSVTLDQDPFLVLDISILRVAGSGGTGSGDGAIIGTTRSGGVGECRYRPLEEGRQRLGSVAPQSGGGAGGRVVACGVIPPTILEGIGYVGECIAFEFDGPMVFTPADGGPAIVCDVLRVCPELLARPVVNRSRELRLRATWWPQLIIDETELLHLDKTRYSALGVAQMSAQGEHLTVSNIGSSGLDGVRVGGHRHWTLEVRVNRIEMAITPPPPGGGAYPELGVRADGFVDGNPGTLGESSVVLGDAAGAFPVRADFNDLGAPEVQVVPCLGGVCLWDRAFVRPAGEVCHLLADPTSPPGIVGCGKLREQLVPGGFEPPCFFWDFDIPVEVGPPGTPLGGGVPADRVLVLAAGGAGTWDTEILSMDLRSSGPPLVVLPSAAPDSFFDVWTELNFTPQEIALLDAADYRLDIDGDGVDEVNEFIRGLDPRAFDGQGTEPSLSSVLITGAGGEEQEFLQVSYQVDPDVVGAEVSLLNSFDLSAFFEDPELWELVALEALPSGNRQYTWRRSTPVSEKEREFVQVFGRVTLLK